MTSNFLDNHQYTAGSISDYESIWGQGFVSPGGLELAQELVGSLELSPGASVLDVGCGLGGSAFVMAQQFNLDVIGIDYSENMMRQAKERCATLALDKQVQFYLADCSEFRQEQHFDAIYSRDVFLHIHDKQRLFHNLYENLGNGGVLLFTDYCCGPKPWSESFTEYVHQRQYCLHTLEEYSSLVKEAGFCDIQSYDWTSRFVQTLESDLAKLSHGNSEPQLIESWQAKLQRAQDGEQRWAMIRAKKTCTPPRP